MNRAEMSEQTWPVANRKCSSSGGELVSDPNYHHSAFQVPNAKHGLWTQVKVEADIFQDSLNYLSCFFKSTSNSFSKLPETTEHSNILSSSADYCRNFNENLKGWLASQVLQQQQQQQQQLREGVFSPKAI